MFIVEKAHLSSHFRSIKKKSSRVPKNYQLAARSFDDKVILHLKTLDLAPNSSNISLCWLSAAVSFLSTVHSEAQDQISNLRSETDDYQALYMDYSLKVLDLCNLVSSAVQQLTDRRLQMNLGLRLLNFSDQIPLPEKLNKAKDALAKSVNNTQESTKVKGVRAKALIKELAVLLDKLPRGKSKTSSGSDGTDLIRRTFYALGVLTVLVGNVLVSVLYRESDDVQVRVPAEFAWADSVNDLFDLTKPNQGRRLFELDEVTSRAVVVRDVLDDVVSEGGDDDVMDRVTNGVKELATAAKKFSEGIDSLTNGVNGLFCTVLKTRNGGLDI